MPIGQFLICICMVTALLSCKDPEKNKALPTSNQSRDIPGSSPYIIVLGTVQDAGSPQIGCEQECCAGLFSKPEASRKVSSLGIANPSNGRRYLFDATPDIASQMKRLTQSENPSKHEIADGIFLTHAHIGHYAGLMYLGKEAMDADNVPVYAMPQMSEFLTKNGPWNQLLHRTNIRLARLRSDSTMILSEDLKVTPFLVPHRDEYSETVGYRIQGPEKTALFIPDIDKWSSWDRNIVEEVKKVDYAFLDATFFSGRELGNRDMSQIPHPSVQETMRLFEDLTQQSKSKIIFIHFNHTNPLLDPESDEFNFVLEHSFGIAKFGDRYDL